MRSSRCKVVRSQHPANHGSSDRVRRRKMRPQTRGQRTKTNENNQPRKDQTRGQRPQPDNGLKAAKTEFLLAFVLRKTAPVVRCRPIQPADNRGEKTRRSAKTTGARRAT